VKVDEPKPAAQSQKIAEKSQKMAEKPAEKQAKK
jgi:hypothetical protein